METHGIKITDRIERPDFALSEQCPFRLYHHQNTTGLSVPYFDMHYELELGMVLSGEMERYYPHAQYTCAAGDVWFCGVWEPHGCYLSEACESEACEVVVMQIRPSLAAGLFFPEAPHVTWMAPFTEPLHRRPVVTEGQRESVIDIGRRMSAFVGRTDWQSLFRIRLLFLELLTLLLAHAPAPDRPPSLQQYTDISPALDLVFHARQLITNAQAAECCAMSYFHFVREFQRLMGITFPTFALRHRLCGAAEELACTDLSVNTVAKNWGFSDSSHMIRQFHRHFGCSPMEYRQQKQVMLG